MEEKITLTKKELNDLLFEHSKHQLRKQKNEILDIIKNIPYISPRALEVILKKLNK